MVDKTLELFGSGIKIAIEAAIMATDAGKIKENEEVISCAGTNYGLDAAILVKTAYSMSFFSDFEVREIICMPKPRTEKLAEGEYKNWEGDLDQYYEYLKD